MNRRSSQMTETGLSSKSTNFRRQWNFNMPRMFSMVHIIQIVYGHFIETFISFLVPVTAGCSKMTQGLFYLILLIISFMNPVFVWAWKKGINQLVLQKLCDKFNRRKAEGAILLDTRWKKICELSIFAFIEVSFQFIFKSCKECIGSLFKRQGDWLEWKYAIVGL